MCVGRSPAATRVATSALTVVLHGPKAVTARAVAGPAVAAATISGIENTALPLAAISGTGVAPARQAVRLRAARNSTQGSIIQVP